MSQGGYIVVFWTKAATLSKHVNFQVQFGMEYSQYYTEGVSHRILDGCCLRFWTKRRCRTGGI